MNGFCDDESASDESLRCLRFLVKCGADVNSRDLMKQTALHHACTKNNINVVRELLKFSATNIEVRCRIHDSHKKNVLKLSLPNIILNIERF